MFACCKRPPPEPDASHELRPLPDGTDGALPIIIEDTHGVQDSLVSMENMITDITEVYQQVSRLCNDYSNKWINRVANDQHLDEFQSTKEQLVALCSIGTLIAQCFDDACKETKRVRAAIRETSRPSIKNDIRRARQQVLRTSQDLLKAIRQQASAQQELNKINRQLTGTFSSRLKRNVLEFRRNQLRETLRLNEAETQNATGKSTQAKNELEAETARLLHFREQRGLEMLTMLNTHMKRLLEAVQVRPSSNDMETIASELENEQDT